MNKVNVIWLEADGCSGNIISFLNSAEPTVRYLLENVINITFSNAVMGEEGESAWESFLNTLNKEFILIVEGAISLKGDGYYDVIANYRGERITAKRALELAAQKATYILAVGICACYGGVSAARPNPTQCISVKEFLGEKQVVRVPGCPCNPRWLSGTILQLVNGNRIALDEEGKPLMYYGRTIHDRCPRRGDFDEKRFAKSLGEPGCLFRLGCRGPVTRVDCPVEKWNNHKNWPIGVNSCCVGCTTKYFPDGMEPFER